MEVVCTCRPRIPVNWTGLCLVLCMPHALLQGYTLHNAVNAEWSLSTGLPRPYIMMSMCLVLDMAHVLL